MSDRLATIAPDLVDLLRRQPEHRLRAIAVRMAELAEAHGGIADHRFDDALASLRAGHLGDTESRQPLLELASELDGVAWDLQDRVKGGTAPEEDYLVAFARGRAASTLWWGLDISAINAANGSVYEAHAMVGDLATIRSEIASVISAHTRSTG